MLNDAQPAPPSSTQGQGTPRCCWMEILLKESEHLYSGEARLKSPMYEIPDQLWLICLFQVSVAFDGRIELTNTMFPRQVGPDVHDQKKWLILPKWQPPHCQVGKRKQTLVNYLGNEPVVWVKRVMNTLPLTGIQCQFHCPLSTPWQQCNVGFDASGNIRSVSMPTTFSIFKQINCRRYSPPLKLTMT